VPQVHGNQRYYPAATRQARHRITDPEQIGELKKVVAQKVGVSAQTFSEWQTQPAFQAYLNQLKLAALERARDQAAGG
jgi:hypothetical protein